MWFIFALITILMWGSADLFYKIASPPDDNYSHLKIVVSVGLVMGIHAFSYMLITKTAFDPINMLIYFPVSALYILSMALGYFGLRYIEQSLSSPICNSSGAAAALLCFIFLGQTMEPLQLMAVIVICIGIMSLSAIQKRKDVKNAGLYLSQEASGEKKYISSKTALLFPVLYCIIDGLGTFADAFYLDRLMSEADALLAYEFTFAVIGLVSAVWLCGVKKWRFSIGTEKSRLAAAVFETAGQFFYVYAMAENSIVSAPLVSSYSIVSIILSRLFLKERLTRGQYVSIFFIMAAIAVLGME